MASAIVSKEDLVFHIGERVVCVNDRHWPHRFSYAPTFPKKGSVYTIREIAERKSQGYDEDGLLLAEIVNPTLVLNC